VRSHGVTIERLRTLGLSASGTGRIRFDSCLVKRDQLLGTAGEGFGQVQRARTGAPPPSRHTKLSYDVVALALRGVPEMDDPIFTELRKLVGQHQKIVYEAVKADTVAQLPHESQLFAKAMQEHIHLRHIHNALEFADLREGAPYEITVGGEPVNPLAHLTAHAAVKGQLEQDPLVRAAFEKMLATGPQPIMPSTFWVHCSSKQSGKPPVLSRPGKILRGHGAFTSANFKNSSGIRRSAKNSRGSSRPIILLLNRGTPRRGRVL
jgi:hypothetical protein